MCDFGGSSDVADIGRYDFNYAWDSIYRQFFSAQNAMHLKAVFVQMGYPEVQLGHLHPFMVEVYSATTRTGFDPSLCRRSQYTVDRLNRELVEYMIPIFENFKCSYRAYIMDQKHFRVLDPPISDNCRTRQVLFNNRFP